MKRTAILCLSVALLATSCTDDKSADPGKPADPNDEKAASAQVIAAFAAGWVKAWAPDGKPTEAAALTDAPTTFGPALDAIDSALVAQSAKVTPKGEPECSDDRTCTQDLDVEAILRGIGTMKWTTKVTATRPEGGDGWKVKGTGDAIYPGLADTNTLKRTRTLPPRASLLDRTGKPLTQMVPVVMVGVESGTKPTAATYAAFAKYLDVDAARLKKRAQAAPPGQFIEAITLRADDWTKVRARIDPLPGALSIGETQSLPETASFARGLIGGMKQATADLLKNAGPTASASDQVGSSGLQYAFQKELAGTPGGTVIMRDKKTKLTVKPVFKQAGKPGTPVKTSLDLLTQRAAERAVASSKLPVSLVAVQASTGQVLAAANGPTSSSYNRAFVGRYAPGSTFKIVSAAALLGTGMTAASPANCPGGVTIYGKPFKNYDALAPYGAGSLQKAFEQSCNTAFIANHVKLPKGGVTNAAAMFGFGQEYDTSITSYSGTVPAPKDDADKAASMIGQGTVTASPLQMALVAAAVKHGTAMKPVLVPGKNPAGPAAKPLPAATVNALRAMMRTTVTNGTAHGLAASGTVSAKTGTAEVSVKGKVTTNGWMVGYRGDIAFAVIVEGGKSGSTAAGPIVKSFLALTK